MEENYSREMTEQTTDTDDATFNDSMCVEFLFPGGMVMRC